MEKLLQSIVNSKIVNHYAPTDEVLNWANNEKYVKGPLGLMWCYWKTCEKISSKIGKTKKSPICKLC